MITNFTSTNRCPICGRFKTAYKNKCHGFITSDGNWVYCSREENAEGQPRFLNPYGKMLYRHPLHSTTAISPPAFPTTAKPSDGNPPKQSQKKRKFTKSLQTDKDSPGIAGKIPWDAEAMEKELDEVIRQYQERGFWPYS